MNKPRMTPPASGLRLAAIVYVAVLLLGLGGAGAHALWKLSGTAVGTVVAGTWAPKKIAANEVKCSRKDSNGDAFITVSWPAVDADSYALSLTGKNADLTENTATLSQTFQLDKPGLFGNLEYKLNITPMVGSGSSAVAGAPTNIKVKVSYAIFASVDCSAA